MGVYAVILAGGSGTRMGLAENKIFLPLRGIPAIVRTIAPFSTLCDGIVLVAKEEEQPQMCEILRKFGLDHLVTSIVCGGDSRQASVASGLAALSDEADIVLVHDGARCLVTEEVILRVISSVQQHGSGIAAMPVTDTIKSVAEDLQVHQTLDRSRLYAMQTPQGFRTHLLFQAHRHAEASGFCGTDDAALLEHAGMPVFLCAGHAENIKLTTPMDILLAKTILQSRVTQEAEL